MKFPSLFKGKNSSGSKELSNIAATLGFEPQPVENNSLEDRMKIISAGAHDSVSILALYQQADRFKSTPSKESGYDIYLCEYQSWAPGVGARVSSYNVAICLVSPDLNLPRVSILTIPQFKGFMGSVMKKAMKVEEKTILKRMKKISFDRERFREYFLVYALEDSLSVKKLSEKIMDHIKNKGNITIDIDKDILIATDGNLQINALKRSFDQHAISEIINIVQDLYVKLKT